MFKKPFIHKQSLRFRQNTLYIILILSAFLRLYKLGSYPALNADEAAIGYNAYSLIETGKDEHGNPWPIHFQSFNDYKPGLYVYLVMPFVKVLGLNEWSVRLPNAILGIAAIYILYLILKMVNIKMENIAAMLLAISPWHIHFSRGGWEVNTATFFILLGAYCFLGYLRNRKLLGFELSVLSFALSFYTYHSARIVTPLLVLGLLVIYWKEIDVGKYFKHFVICGLSGLLFITPLIVDFTKSNIISRAAGVGLFADLGPIERTNEQRMEHTGITSRPIHNKLTNYALSFLKNWNEHYHGLFLFVSGDVIQRSAVPETGQMYLFEMVTVLVGFVVIIRSHSKIQYTKFYILIMYWFLIAPIPAALTFQSPHALRSQNMVIPLTIISAIGLAYIIERIKKLHVTRYALLRIFSHYTLYIILYTCILWSFSRYLHMYYRHMSVEYPFSSQYGVKELVKYLETKTNNSVIVPARPIGGVSEQSERIRNQAGKDSGQALRQAQDIARMTIGETTRHKNIVVTDEYDQPYIMFLFYLKYPPESFQKDHKLTPRDRYGFSTVNSFGSFIFKPINWDMDKMLYRDSLIIGSGKEIPDETNIIKRIYGSNGYLYFKVVEN